MNDRQTRNVVNEFFTNLAEGKLSDALALLSDDIRFDLPQDRWNEVIPYLGTHNGVAEVVRAFEVRAETTEVLDYELRDLRAEGDTAFAVIYTRAAQRRTGQEFEIEDAHKLVVGPSGKITSWVVYFDPNSEVAAFNADREERLVEAVRTGDHRCVAELIRFGANVNHRDPRTGLTPLMIAAGRGDAPLVRSLLDAGADVYTTDSRGGGTALHKAVQGGDLDTVRVLVEAGAFVDAPAATTGHTPLMDALWYKWPDITGYLLDRNASVNLSTHYGFSMKEHFEYELNVNSLGKEKLLAADELLKRRARSDEDSERSQPLMAAVTQGDAARVRELLAGGAEVDARFPVVNGFNDAHTPLLVAARDGHTDCVRALLDAGADVNATEPTFGASPLHKAVYNGHADITALLVAAPGVDLDYQGATNGYTPLHDALWHGYRECAQILIDAGARLDVEGHDGKTPLDIAVDVFGPDHEFAGAIRAMAA